MTTRWCKKAPRIAFIVFIVVTLIIGISILVALVNGAFSKSDSENNNLLNIKSNDKTPPNSSLLGSSTLELSYVTTTSTTTVNRSAVTSDDKSTGKFFFVFFEVSMGSYCTNMNMRYVNFAINYNKIYDKSSFFIHLTL